MERRIIEIKRHKKTYYQPQYKIMFWWFNYMENSIEYDDVVSINREFKDLNDAIAFVEELRFNKEKKVVSYWEY